MTINTALSTGTAQDGSVRTGAAVQGQSGSTVGAGQTTGGASGQGATSTSAITSLVTPGSATVGGFTNAQVRCRRGLDLQGGWSLNCRVDGL
jgi:hypothetical protein